MPDSREYGTMENPTPAPTPTPRPNMSDKPRIHFCTSAEPHNVQAFIDECNTKFPQLDIQYHQLPYNDVDKFVIRGTEMDALVLCHSINNRRFAITNVMDALYNKFLPNASKALGKQRIGVIVHDFPKEKLDTDEKREVEMEAFQHKQPSTFDHSSLQLMAGKLDGPVEIDKTQWDELQKFLETITRASGPVKSPKFLYVFHLVYDINFPNSGAITRQPQVECSPLCTCWCGDPQGFKCGPLTLVCCGSICSCACCPSFSSCSCCPRCGST